MIIKKIFKKFRYLNFLSCGNVLLIVFVLSNITCTVSSIIAFGFGCNSHYRLTFSHPLTSGDCAGELVILPQKITSFSLNVSTSSPIRSICASCYNTVTLNEDGSVYSNGFRNNGIAPYGPSQSTLLLVFRNIYDTLGQNIDLVCGNEVVFFVRHHNSQKQLWAFGKNSFWELGLSHNIVVNVPTLIFNDFKMLESGALVTIATVPSTSSNYVVIAGSNSFLQLGDVSYTISSRNTVFTDLLIGNEICEIKLISVFRYGVFIVYENKHVYFWGKETFKIVAPNREGFDVLAPVQIDFFSPYSDIETNANIIQIECKRQCCFVLIEEFNQKRTIYSWGHNVFSSLEVWMLGRNYTSSDYLYPKEIEYGELNKENEMISLIASSPVTVFFITNKFNVYAIGYSQGSFAGVIPEGDWSMNLKRILSPPINTYKVTSVEVSSNLNEHFIFAYVVEDFPIEIVIFIAVGAVAVICFFAFLIVVFIVTAILLCMFLTRAWEKKEKEKISDDDGSLGTSDKSLLKKYDEKEVQLAEKHLAKLKINAELFTVKKEEVNLLSKIGSGGSKTIIFKALWYEKEIAVKLFHTRLFDGQNDFDAFEKEVKIASGINHPNLIRFFGCCLSPPRVMILICENGDLQQYILGKKMKNESVNIVSKLGFCENICSALTYLHSNNIIHRDLKLQNVLVTKDLVGKVIDFGLSRVINSSFSKMTKRVGTSHFMSPEVVLGNKYDYKADIFSFGIILFILLTEEINPYNVKKDNLEQFLGNSVEIKVAQDPNFRPVFDDDSKYNDELVKLCKNCWKHNPSERSSISEIKECLALEVGKLKKNGVLLSMDSIEN